MGHDTCFPRRIVRTHYVARLLGVTPARIRAMRDKLQPFAKTEDGEALYDLDEVERFAAERASCRTR